MGRKKNSDIDDFFEGVSALSGFCDKMVVENVYYGMVRSIIGQLRRGEDIFLPNFGTFYLKKMKERAARNVNTGMIEMLQEKRSVGFRPVKNLKNFLN